MVFGGVGHLAHLERRKIVDLKLEVAAVFHDWVARACFEEFLVEHVDILVGTAEERRRMLAEDGGGQLRWGSRW